MNWMDWNARISLASASHVQKRCYGFRMHFTSGVTFNIKLDLTLI